LPPKQKAYGNQAMLRTLRRRSQSLIQPELLVNEPGDAYEREADKIAGQIAQMPNPEIAITPAPAEVSRKCAACGSEEQQKLQEKPAGTADVSARDAPDIVHQVLRSPGEPLDPKTRAFFEPRFGRDFSSVRLHSDALAAESAKHIHALAYTVGNDVVFGSGRYAPKTKAGLALLAHELTHVIQQRYSPAKATPMESMPPVGGADDGVAPQQEGAEHLTAGRSRSAHPGPTVQRQAGDTDETAAAAGPAHEPSGSIDITEALFEVDTSGPVKVQASPDSAMGPLLQRQSIPPPPPAYPNVYQWFFDITSQSSGSDPGSLFGLTCSDGRERGYYVMWNENTNKSVPGPIEMGDQKKGCGAPHMSLGPVPADSKPVYPVGFFHTHPLASPGCHKIGVGPSDIDKGTAKSTGLPGVVMDTKTPTSTCKDAGYFFFGPTQRS
jgi:Domain of unknown function (DUF4157)